METGGLGRGLRPESVYERWISFDCGYYGAWTFMREDISLQDKWKNSGCNFVWYQISGDQRSLGTNRTETQKARTNRHKIVVRESNELFCFAENRSAYGLSIWDHCVSWVS